MTSRNRFVLFAVFVAALLLTSCAGQVAAPEPSPSEQEESADPQPDYEYGAAGEEQAPTIATAAAQIYYVFFNTLEIIEFAHVRSGDSWQWWGHRVGDEVRMTRIVFINQIEGFNDPVLVLFEFILEEDGVTVNELGLLNAYLIRDGELCSDLSRAEFEMIFGEFLEDGPGWSTRCQDGVMHSVDINGEKLFYFVFEGDVRTDGSMDMLIDMLREHL